MSGPFLPSGRSAASTCQMVPQVEWAEQMRVVAAAMRLPMAVASAVVTVSSAGSATKSTSMSDR